MGNGTTTGFGSPDARGEGEADSGVLEAWEWLRRPWELELGARVAHGTHGDCRAGARGGRAGRGRVSGAERRGPGTRLGEAEAVGTASQAPRATARTPRPRGGHGLGVTVRTGSMAPPASEREERRKRNVFSSPV